MPNINNDLTLKQNYLSKYRFLIHEYEQVKRKEHACSDLPKIYSAHHTDPRSFLKYYNLFNNRAASLTCCHASEALNTVNAGHRRRMNSRYWNYVPVDAISLR